MARNHVLIGLAIAGLLLALPAGAQQDTLSQEEQWAEHVRTFTVHKQFLIAGTFRSFRAGIAHARKLAERTGLEYRPQTTLLENSFDEQIVDARRALLGRNIPTFVKSAPIWMGCMH